MTAPRAPRSLPWPALALAALLPLGAAHALDAPHDLACVQCHATHDGTVMDTSEGLCRSCHFAGGPGPEMANHVRPGGAVALRCGDCHDPHVQGVGKFLRSKVRTPGGEVEVTLSGPTDPRFCQACHAQPVGAAVGIDWVASKHGAAYADPVYSDDPVPVFTGYFLQPPWLDVLRGDYSLACLDCHQPHVGELISLIKPSVNGVTVPVGADRRTTLTAACSGCHVIAPATIHHNDDTSEKAGGCTACHLIQWDSTLNAYVTVSRGCFAAGCHRHGGFF